MNSNSVTVFLLYFLTRSIIGYKHHTHHRITERPEFVEDPQNVSVILGREGTLDCKVRHAGSYKVAWLRVDTQTILTIADSVITRNSRIQVSHDEEQTWTLRIKEVKQRDAGTYMCQINTEPMRKRIAVLSVVVPPDILDYLSSSDTIADEGADVSLRCAAAGDPKPTISWKREDGSTFFIENRDTFIVDGSVLNITRISRLHMGNYLCIASNGVPPSVSKKIAVKVEFPPTVWVTNQRYRAPLGSEINIDCVCESFPRGLHYWVREDAEVIVQGPRFQLEISENSYRTINRLTIKHIQMDDFGPLKCICKNPIGVSEAAITITKLESALWSEKRQILADTAEEQTGFVDLVEEGAKAESEFSKGRSLLALSIFPKSIIFPALFFIFRTIH
ncbi:lachesin-like isoform X1 [Artemia franciscana]|uniref:lachesin-like isoform X1 n=1 Tax=Artemia franciscana TaxID=6661 RepID=UPI0032DA355E